MSFSSKGHQNPTTARNLGDTVSKLVFVVNLTDLTCESEQVSLLLQASRGHLKMTFRASSRSWSASK